MQLVSSRWLVFTLPVLLMLGTGSWVGCSDDDDSGNNNQVNNNGNENTNQNQNNNNNANVTVPQVVECENPALTPPASGTCSVQAGSDLVVVQGTVLAPTQILRNGQVAFDRATGHIVCVDCDCSGINGFTAATRVDCANGVISPGLINMHDHLNYAQNAPVAHGDERFEHRHDWREGIRGHTEVDYESGSNNNALWGELRMLMSGVTSIQGASGRAGLVRNLEGSLGGLSTNALYEVVFPLDDIDGTLRDGDCNYGSDPTNESDIAGEDSYVPHVAEGIDHETRNEFLCQMSANNGGHDLLERQTAMIHAMALNAEDSEAIRDAGSKIIWSPRTNIDLYGNTAPVTLYHTMGIPIALGTDWVVSGSMNLLRELHCVDEYNQRNLGGFFSDYEIWRMVTSMGGVTAHMAELIGSLGAGKVADISIYDGSESADYRAIIDGEVQDVVLVVRGGLPMYGDSAVMEGLGQDAAAGCEELDVCTVMKRICAEQDTGKTIAELETDAGGSPYRLFWCGDPQDEPSCVPTRLSEYTGVPSADDDDGDGIANGTDNCPSIFNPIQPVDDGVQGDQDGDGVGDVCDPCPLDANVTDCYYPDPDDADGDGVLNGVDNCPDDVNPGQADGDADGLGDDCDPCPTQAFTCSATIMQLQNPSDPDYVTPGTTVTTSGIVTAVKSSGFFIQDPVETQWSGIFVFTGSAPTLDEGVTVEVTGTAEEYYDLTQITNPSFTVTNSTPSPLTPVPLTFADVMNGASTAEAYESVLVTLTGGGTCSDANPDDPDDHGQMVIQDGSSNTLYVDDFIWADWTTSRTVGTVYTTVTGPMYWSFSQRKILPRRAEDLVAQ